MNKQWHIWLPAVLVLAAFVILGVHLFAMVTDRPGVPRLATLAWMMALVAMVIRRWTRRPVSDGKDQAR